MTAVDAENAPLEICDDAVASIVTLCVTHEYEVDVPYIEVDPLTEITTLLAPDAGACRAYRYANCVAFHCFCFFI